MPRVPAEDGSIAAALVVSALAMAGGAKLASDSWSISPQQTTSICGYQRKRCAC
jgi:hypothetical protein